MFAFTYTLRLCVRPSQVLIGHMRKKMNKQMFSERCSLCQDVLPFTNNKQAVCKNGHMWLRYHYFRYKFKSNPLKTFSLYL